MSNDRALIFASVVILVVIMAFRGHIGVMPFNNVVTGSQTVNARFAVHMAQLQIRHTLVRVGRVISIR